MDLKQKIGTYIGTIGLSDSYYSTNIYFTWKRTDNKTNNWNLFNYIYRNMCYDLNNTEFD